MEMLKEGAVFALAKAVSEIQGLKHKIFGLEAKLTAIAEIVNEEGSDADILAQVRDFLSCHWSDFDGVY